MTFRFPEKPSERTTFHKPRTYVPEVHRAKTPSSKPLHLPTRRAKQELPTIARPEKKSTKPVETLSGFVQGKKASDLEERLANSLVGAGLKFRFQYLVDTAHTLPDQAKNVDFVVFNAGRVYPIEVYGSYFHSSAGDRLHDQVRERELDDKFEQFGWERMRILWDYDLFDQEQANLAVRRLFI